MFRNAKNDKYFGVYIYIYIYSGAYNKDDSVLLVVMPTHTSVIGYLTFQVADLKWRTSSKNGTNSIRLCFLSLMDIDAVLNLNGLTAIFHCLFKQELIICHCSLLYVICYSNAPIHVKNFQMNISANLNFP